MIGTLYSSDKKSNLDLHIPPFRVCAHIKKHARKLRTFSMSEEIVK